MLNFELTPGNTEIYFDVLKRRHVELTKEEARNADRQQQSCHEGIKNGPYNSYAMNKKLVTAKEYLARIKR